jgi:tetratricopeptide (TPR) repeat protein
VLHTFRPLVLSILSVLLVAACSTIGGVTAERQEPVTEQAENRDLSCAYFYFLWGSHAELGNRLEEALEAYQKALICDPTATYIAQKLPLLMIKMGDSEQARELLENNILQDPRDTVSRSLLASIYIQQQKRNQAIEQYRAVIAYDPNNPEVLLRLGALLSQTGEYAEAKQVLLDLVTIDQEAYLARLYLARLAVQLDETDGAEEQYKAALALNWSAELAYEIADFYQRTDQYEKAIELLRRVLAENETDEQARLGIVQALLSLNREEEAIAELGLARQYSNSPERISLVLSRLYLRIGDQNKAIDNLQAILDGGDNSEARYLLAIIYAEQEKFEEALTLLNGIGETDDQFADALFLKTKILHDTGRSDEALRLLEAFLAGQQTDKPMFIMLAASLNRDLGNEERSLALLEEGVERFPTDEQLLFSYGLQLESSDRLDEAIGVMESIIALNPDHAEALNFVGYSWADANRNLEQALDYINRAMLLKPGNGYIQDSLGWVHFRLGNLQRAERELLGALQLLPEDPHVHEHLGDLYRAMGDQEKARSYYLNALERFSDEKKIKDVTNKLEDLEAR